MNFYMYVHIFRYFEANGPNLDEKDFSTLASPLYECLKFDVDRFSSQKMLELTQYGKQYLGKKGIHLNKIGRPCEAPKSVANLPRSETLDFKDEETKADDQKVQNLGSRVKVLIEKYYTEPDGLVSNRGKKMQKKCLENYERKIALGYKMGDRELFHFLARDIGLVCTHPDQRPSGEDIFRKITRMMDKKPDQPEPISDNCY